MHFLLTVIWRSANKVNWPKCIQDSDRFGESYVSAVLLQLKRRNPWSSSKKVTDAIHQNRLDRVNRVRRMTDQVDGHILTSRHCRAARRLQRGPRVNRLASQLARLCVLLLTLCTVMSLNKTSNRG